VASRTPARGTEAAYPAALFGSWESLLDAMVETAARELSASTEYEDRLGSNVDAATYDYWNERLSHAPTHLPVFLCTGITTNTPHRMPWHDEGLRSRAPLTQADS
jgi:hypothetical protein